MTMLNWRTLPLKNRDDRWTRGTELESCIPDGFLSRFRIVSVRTVGRDAKGAMEYDVKYRLYDAATVTDAEIRAGIGARNVGDYPTLDAVLAAIEPHRYEPETDDE